MRDTVKRVTRALSQGEPDAIERSMRASFLVSADMAHALHPNYMDKHDSEHQPKFHEGALGRMEGPRSGEF
jgi:aspartyl aminopeptidase